VAESVTIDRRFNGPPGSAQGGYACGLIAERIDAAGAAVSLRAPPPLETPLEVRRGADGTVALFDGEARIADGEPAALDLPVPEPVSLEAAARASEDFPWRDRHPFPTCFGCGPERSPQEAIAVLPGPVADRDLVAARWTPLEEFAGPDGAVTPLYTWAALDCPTSFGALPPDAPTHVLARLEARLVAPVRAGEPHTVIAWQVSREGRKAFGAAAIHAADGTLCAVSEGLWIQVRDPSSVGARR
jgi:hypothetical protein